MGGAKESLVDVARPYARLRSRVNSIVEPHPALEAAQLEAVRKLASAFEAKCAHVLGGRKWFSHFEAWLWTSRGTIELQDAKAVPVLLVNANDIELIRKLSAAGVGPADAASMCNGLSELAASLRGQLECLSPQLRALPGVVRNTPSATTPLVTLTCAGVDVHCTEEHLEKLRLLYETTSARHARARARRRGRGAATVSAAGRTDSGHIGTLGFFDGELGGAVAGSFGPSRKRARARPYPLVPPNLQSAPQGMGAASKKEPYDEAHFVALAYCCLARVLALQGGHEKAGGMQAACPAAVFDCLRIHLGVAAELFASPLNARFPVYCSASADVDAPFGSVGSFFDAKPRRGAYLANPPFAPVVVDAMFARMARLLKIACRTGEALTFVVVIPHWPEKRCWQGLATNRHMRCHLLLLQQEHGYVEGGQQYQAEQRWRPSNHDSSVFFLQSDEAAAAIPVTAAVQRAVRDAFQSHCTRSKRFARRASSAD